MKKLRIIQAYPQKGKTNLNHLKGKTGVYLIAEQKPSKDKEVVYIGYSTGDLYKIITRHFQKWKDPRQRRVVYKPNGRNKYFVKVILTNKPDAYLLERTLIYSQKPRDNDHKYKSIKRDIAAGRLKRVGDRLEKAKTASKNEEQEQYKYNKEGELMEKSQRPL